MLDCTRDRVSDGDKDDGEMAVSGVGRGDGGEGENIEGVDLGLVLP